MNNSNKVLEKKGAKKKIKYINAYHLGGFIPFTSFSYSSSVSVWYQESISIEKKERKRDGGLLDCRTNK
jgi:hypothetical protein